MLNKRLQQALEGLNGVVMIDVDDFINGCWTKECVEYWILHELGEVAQRVGIPIFIDRGRGLLGDYEATNKDDLTQKWIHIPRFNYDTSAKIIERTLGVPREETFLGFGGTYSESCVRKFLWALCDEKVIPEVQSDCPIKPLTENPIDRQFAKGKLLYELTENRYTSLFFDTTIRQPLEAQCEERSGEMYR